MGKGVEMVRAWGNGAGEGTGDLAGGMSWWLSARWAALLCPVGEGMGRGDLRSSAHRAGGGPAGRGGQGVWCGAHGACLGDSVWVVGAVPTSGVWVGSHMTRVKSQGQSGWGREGKVTIESQIQYHPTPRD